MRLAKQNFDPAASRLTIRMKVFVENYFDIWGNSGTFLFANQVFQQAQLYTDLDVVFEFKFKITTPHIVFYFKI